MAIKKLLKNEVFRNTHFANYDFENTASVEPLKEDLINQNRAKDSIRFGLSIDRYGYNIFCSGNSSARRKIYLQSVLNEFAKNKPIPNDLLYINNFENETEPLLVSLPHGLGSEFKKEMDSFSEKLTEEMFSLFDIDTYKKTEELLFQEYDTKLKELYEKYHSKIKEMDFIFIESNDMLVPVPAKNDKALTQEEYDNLPKEEVEIYFENKKKIDILMIEMINKENEILDSRDQDLTNLDIKISSKKLEKLLSKIDKKYSKHNKKIANFLENIQKDIVKNIEQFKPKESEEKDAFMSLINPVDSNAIDLKKYTVNLIVDNKDLTEAPIIFMDEGIDEYKLFGAIKFNLEVNSLFSDFTKIIAGDIVKANGGYLVINVDDLFKYYFVWDKLKTSLKNKKVRISSRYYKDILLSDALMPEEIDIDVKVILIGSAEWYHILVENDPDFKELFGIHAIFESEMNRDEKSETEFLRFISKYCNEHNVKHLTKDAVCSVIEYASRLVENQEKLTLNYKDIYGLLNEADAWAKIMNKDLIDAECIDKTLIEKEKRVDTFGDRYEDYYKNDIIMMKTDGEEVGTINGLVVMDFGDFEKGSATKITATTYRGEEGVISVDRIAKLTGSIHNKSVEIIRGFLGNTFAQEKPLSLCVNLSFEQNYGMIEGDSATVAELCSVLSELSGYPIKQCFAVTGSMNQKGDVQAIGGVNYKIEGFYNLCAIQGFTGKQGVIIPSTNVKDLMLRKEVREAIEKDNFAIYCIDRIDEAVQILMGVSYEEVVSKIKERLLDIEEKNKEKK